MRGKVSRRSTGYFMPTRTYLAELLMDQMSMAVSIESRIPLLDHQLVEFAASVPESLKLRGKGTNTS